MNDSDTLGDGQHDDRSTSSGGTVKSTPPDTGRPQVGQTVRSRSDAPAALTEDPFGHLTPTERFARALERRDALVRKRSEAGTKL
jgi:hypothetical protein